MRDRPKLLAYVWAIVRDHHAAEDLLQEVSVLAVHKRLEIDDDAHLGRWLRQSLRYKAMNLMSKAEHRTLTLDAGVLDQLDRRWDAHRAFGAASGDDRVADRSGGRTGAVADRAGYGGGDRAGRRVDGGGADRADAAMGDGGRGGAADRLRVDRGVRAGAAPGRRRTGAKFSAAGDHDLYRMTWPQVPANFPKWTQGRWPGKGAIEFDGVDDYLEPSSKYESHFDFRGSFSISVWLRSAGFTSTWEAIVTKGDGSWRLHRYQSTDTVSFDTNHPAGTNTLAATTNVNDGNWHHVAAVFDADKTPPTKRSYVDGKLEGTSTVAAPINVNDYRIVVGNNQQASPRYLHGVIDELGIWRRPLTDTEIKSMYDVGRP